MPEDTVYTVVETAFERVRDMVNVLPVAKDVKIENMPNVSIPLHVDAIKFYIKFYKEKGLQIPDKLTPPEYKEIGVCKVAISRWIQFSKKSYMLLSMF